MTSFLCHVFFFLPRILLILKSCRSYQGGSPPPCTCPLDAPWVSSVANKLSQFPQNSMNREFSINFARFSGYISNCWYWIRCGRRVKYSWQTCVISFVVISMVCSSSTLSSSVGRFRCRSWRVESSCTSKYKRRHFSQSSSNFKDTGEKHVELRQPDISPT